MRFAIVQDGIVINIVIASPEFAEQNTWIAADESACIGGKYNPETGFSWKEDNEEEID